MRVGEKREQREGVKRVREIKRGETRGRMNRKMQIGEEKREKETKTVRKREQEKEEGRREEGNVLER